MNLGQLVGSLRLQIDDAKEREAALPHVPLTGGVFRAYKYGDGRGTGRIQKRILKVLGDDPTRSSDLANMLDLSMVTVCVALVAMVKRGLVVRHGTRGKYTYTRGGA